LVRDLRVGDVIPDGPPGTASFQVEYVAPARLLVLHSTTHVPLEWRQRFGAAIDWVWTFHLSRVDGGTRLLLRTRGRIRPWWLTAGYVGLLVPADHVMATSMLTGIKRRVEAAGSGRRDQQSQYIALDVTTGQIVEASIHIARPAEAVFDYVTDLRREPDWNSQLRDVRKLTAGPIGAQTYRVRFGRGVGEATITNVAFDRPRAWTAISTSRWLNVRSDGAVHPQADGSRLTMRTQPHPRDGPRLMAPMLRRVMRVSWAPDLQAIKERLEAETEASAAGGAHA
jgi:uncharacterized membrane protein